jgi:ABC-type transport system substrate-binding protein
MQRTCQHEEISFSIQHVATTRVPTTPQQTQDLQREAAFPGFLVRPSANDTASLMAPHSSRARLASNGFRAAPPINYGRYRNPEIDGLIERYAVTVPLTERTGVIGEIVHHLADQLVMTGLYYIATATAVGRRLANVSQAANPVIWNSHEWGLRS